MEELIKAVTNLTQEIKEMRREQNDLRTEIRELKEENKGMKVKIEQLETRIHMLEQAPRKNNVVMKGMNPKIKTNIEVTRWLKAKLALDIKVKETVILAEGSPKPLLLVKCESWADKKAVMMAKKQLKGTDVYIDDDLSPEDRKIQSYLRRIKKEKVAEGKTVKLGYNKIIIDNEKWIVDKISGKIRKAAHEEGAKN